MNAKLDLKSFKVLVADDSRLVCNSIAVILREIGFISDNIICAYKPVDAINHCKNYRFDVVICDYNFNSKLNGYQLLDELRHMQLLASHTFFVFLTGENQPKIVRTIIDGEPDDYLLKPFNKPFFSSRLYLGIQRKQALSSIYAALHEQNYQLAIDEAELLQPFFPKYILTIGILKARALMALKEFDAATQEYESLLDIYNNDLIKARLAHCLVAKGDRDGACDVLSTLENQENNPYFHDIRATMSIQSGDLPDAILHLKKATLLMEVGAERELIISNLSLALGNYEDAFNYIKQYADKNEGTYRDSEHIKLNYVRCFLYNHTDDKLPNIFENQFILIKPKINMLSKLPNMSFQYELLNVHIHLIRNEVRQASSKISELQPPDQLHFYDYYHYVYLLDKLGASKEIKAVLPNVRRSIRENQIMHIKRSQEYMATCFEKIYCDNQRKISDIKLTIEHMNDTQEKNGNLYLELYMQLKELMPRSVKVSLAIIKLIANNHLTFGDYELILRLLRECDEVISSQLTNEEKSKNNYNELYSKALEKVA